MLGDDSEEVHAHWLHRLGNLTLTGYNAEYSNSTFLKKRDRSGGFRESAVFLNKDVAAETEWTSTQMEERGRRLADRALGIWPRLSVNEEMLQEARKRKMRLLAEEKPASRAKMKEGARRLFEILQPRVLDLGTSGDVIEISENIYHVRSVDDIERALEVIRRSFNSVR